MPKNSMSKSKKTDSKVVAVHAQQYAGPIPQASEMAWYENIQAGAADRILKMAEKEQELQIEITKSNANLQRTTLKLQGRDHLLGAVFSFVTVIFVVSIGVFLLLSGYDVTGFGTLVAGLGFLGYLFWPNKKK